MALLDDHLNLCEALIFEDASKREVVMQEEHDFLMANAMWEPTNLLEDHKNIRCKWMCRTKKDALYKIVRFNA